MEDVHFREWQDFIYPLFTKQLIYFDSEIKDEDKKILICPIMIYFYKKYGKKEFVNWMKNF